MKKKSLAVSNMPRECQYCEHYATRGIYRVCTYQSWLSVALPTFFPSMPRVVMPYGTCAHFALSQQYVKVVGNNPRKKLCGLHGAHVLISPENNNGTCACIGCMGTHCQTCQEYKNKVNEISDGIDVATTCTRCIQRQR